MHTNIKLANDGQLDVIIKAKSATADKGIVASKLTVSMGVFVISNSDDFKASAIISKDTPNDLKIGSDDKLVSQPNDNDFLADYILASN